MRTDGSQSGSETDRSSSEEYWDANQLMRTFIADVLDLPEGCVPEALPNAEAMLDLVRAFLDYQTHHIQTTLLPSAADGKLLGGYSLARLKSWFGLRALQYLYAGSDRYAQLVGPSFSSNAREFYLEFAHDDIYSLLVGRPGPGWMDGYVVDALRELLLDVLPEGFGDRQRHALGEALRERSDMRDFHYDICDVPVEWLPLRFSIKSEVHRAGGTYVGDALRYLPPDSGQYQELAFIVGRLASYDPDIAFFEINRTWMGDDD